MLLTRDYSYLDRRMSLSSARSLDGTELRLGDESWVVTSRLLGKGGFASVYEARSSKGERAAAKVVDLRQQSAWAISKLRSEAENLARAQTHTHIVRLAPPLIIDEAQVDEALHIITSTVRQVFG